MQIVENVGGVVAVGVLQFLMQIPPIQMNPGGRLVFAR